MKWCPPARRIAFLEGGYDLDALADCAAAAVAVLAGTAVATGGRLRGAGRGPRWLRPRLRCTAVSLDRLAPVREEARGLAERFRRQRGYRIYLVGGIVRDAMRNRPLDTAFDLDLTTDAQPEAVKSILEEWADTLWTQGERFGTIGARRGDRRVEITTHRTERYLPDSRKPEVAFADAIEADLSRRDFTINAMAVELPDGGLVDSLWRSIRPRGWALTHSAGP